DRWFNERIWVAESALEEEDVYWGAALAAAEMIRSGTVGFADHYFYMDRVAEVVAQSGLRANLAWCVFGLGPEAEIGADLEGSIAFAKRWQGAAEGRIRTVLGPHAPYTCPGEFLERVAQAAQRHGLGIHIHLAESEGQVEDSLARYGATPVAFLERIGLLDVPAIAAHCIYVDEADLEILQRKGVHVVQCPNCHMKLGMGVTPVPEMLARGIHVALGTDGAASNNDLDMLQEARLAALLQKHHHRDPEVMPGELALRLATQAGARAMGFPESGAVVPGMAADLILLDLDKPHMRPRHDLVANVLYAAKPSDITHVMVDGRWLLRGGELTTLDEERILYEAERRAWRMVGGELRIVRAYRVGGAGDPLSG
ncbi:MAG: amidohydrolase, partial [Anaerolineae bacterium]|nr:amidohydrolase [Anaerolineae bacterium]